MRKSLVLGTLSLTMLIGLPACGGDDDGTGTSEGETGDGDGDTSGTTGETGETGTDTSSGGDGDGDTTDTTDTGDGDGDTTDAGDGDSADAGDGDSADGGDGDTGNMGDCDMGFSTLVSSGADAIMMTSLTVEGLVSCSDVPINITATGGEICANDAGGGNYYYTVETITFDDVPMMTCGLAQLGLSNLSIANDGDGMQVTVPNPDGGAMTGNQSIAVLGDAFGSALGNDIPATPIDGFVGSLPEGNATVGSDTTLSYDDNNHVLATAMPEVDGPIGPVTLTVTLTGLQGSVTFDP